jgi:hypothetical protein
VQLSVYPANKLQNRARFGLDHTFHDQLASGVQNRDGDTFFVNIEADILRAIHVGRSFPSGLRQTTQTLLSKARPLYCVSIASSYRNVAFALCSE